MNDIEAQLITVGIALAVVAGAYLVDLLCALANVVRANSFSWQKLGRGLAKCLLIAIGTAGFVAIINLLNWLTGRLNIDVSGILGDVSVVGLLGIVLTSAVKYLTNSYKNIQEFFLKGESSQLDTSNSNPDYQGIAEEAKKFVEAVLPARMLNEQQTSEEASKEVDNSQVGQGDSVNPLTRRLPDGDNDYGNGWQCSKYSYYLATGIRMHYAPNPSFGPCNGRDMVNYLCNNCGYVRCGKIAGAIFATDGGDYGHTGMVVDPNSNTVNDANYTPLTVSTHYFNLDAAGATYCCPPGMKPVDPEPTPVHTDIKVGDNVTLKEWVDYYGTPLRKTRDYYTVSELSGDRAVLVSGGTVYAAVNVNNLEKVSVSPSPVDSGFKVGDKVVPTKLVDYDGTKLIQWDPYYTISEISGDRAVLMARGAVWAAMNTAYIRKV